MSQHNGTKQGAVTPPAAHPVTPSHLPRRLHLPKEGLCWLLAAGALLAGGWFRGMNLVLLLAYFMIVIWAVNFLLASRGLRQLQAKRRMTDLVFARTPFNLEVEIRNPRRKSQSNVRIEHVGQSHALRGFFSQIPAAGSCRLKQLVTLPQRGRYVWEPLWSSSSYPFGLVQREVVLMPGEEMIVLPELGRLHRGRLRRMLSQAAPSVGRIRRQARRHPMAQTEFHGLRTFRGGDSPRLIHWRTSARRGELMVREFEEAPTDNLVLILEPWAPERVMSDESRVMSGPRDLGESSGDSSLIAHHSSRLEQAVSLAATICWEWCRQRGDRLVLAIASRRPVILDGVTSREHAVRLLEQLALVRGVSTVDADELLEELGGAALPVGPVLLVTTRSDSMLAETLAARLHRRITTLDAVGAEREDYYEPPASTPRESRDEADRPVAPPALAAV